MSSTDSLVPEFHPNPNNQDDSINDVDDEFDVIVPLKKRGKGIKYQFIQETNEQNFISEFNAQTNATGMIKSFNLENNNYNYKYKRRNLVNVKYYYQCSPKNANCVLHTSYEK